MNYVPRILTCTLALMLLAQTIHAAYPEFSSTKPNGGQRGTDVELTVTGNRLDDFEGLIFMSPGFEMKKVVKVEKNKATVVVGIAPNAALGNHIVRIRTKTGISHGRQFFVGQYPNVDEKEPNDDFANPQVIGFNQTIEGIVQNEDVDYFKLSAKKGQRIALEIDGLRLGYLNFDPYIAVLDKDRFEVGSSDDTILHRQDGYFSVIAPEDGDYTVMVRESSYRGGGNSFYRLHVGSFRRPDVAYPAGGKAGSKTKVRFVERTGEASEEELQLPAQPDASYMAITQGADAPPSGNPFRVVAFDNALEAEPNDEQAKATGAASDPIALNGIIEKPGDIDWFKLALKKGQKVDVQTFAQSVGSPLDSVVNVYNEKGGSLGGNDDGGGRRRLDSKFSVNIPADGSYFVRVTDHLERGGPSFVYRIEIAASEPSVRFASPNYNVNDSHSRQFIAVPRGGRYATLVNVTRNNVSGDMEFKMPALPPGVKLLTDKMPKDLGNITLLFEAAKDAPLSGGAYPITLASLDPNVKVTGYLNQEFDVVRSGNTIYYTEVAEQLPVAVVEEVPFSLEIVKPSVALVAGGLLEMKVKATRKADYKAPIRVLLNWKPPGISALGEQTIAEGQTECSFILDANGSTPAGTWKFAVLGESDGGNGRHYNASPWCEITTAPAYLSAPTMALTALEQGKETEMVCKVENLQPFEGEAEARVVGTPDTIQIELAKIKKDTKEAVFKVKTTDKSPVGKHGNLFVQVAVPVAGGTTIHRIGAGSVLRIDAPRKAPPPKPAAVAAATPAPAKPAEPAKAPEKRLSRLEQLRQEAAEKGKK
ncbi:MAG: PPC domain-containing protein [Verrucomicrobiaceae bacterium]|nr:PPC domain-containing protein [Verrucomicrobiaceae bacterium]